MLTLAGKVTDIPEHNLVKTQDIIRVPWKHTVSACKCSLNFLDQGDIILRILRTSASIISCRIFPVKVGSIKPIIAHERNQGLDESIPVLGTARHIAKGSSRTAQVGQPRDGECSECTGNLRDDTYSGLLPGSLNDHPPTDIHVCNPLFLDRSAVKAFNREAAFESIAVTWKVVGWKKAKAKLRCVNPVRSKSFGNTLSHFRVLAQDS